MKLYEAIPTMLEDEKKVIVNDAGDFIKFNNGVMYKCNSYDNPDEYNPVLFLTHAAVMEREYKFKEEQ